MSSSLPSPHPPSSSGSARHKWTGKTRGGVCLFGFATLMLPLVGSLGARIGCYIAATGFLLVGGRNQYGSFAYWRRLTPQVSFAVVVMRSWRRYASFGRIMCDRFLAYLHMDRFSFTYRNSAALHQAVSQPTGCILLAAHVGNWELSGLRLGNLAKVINVVMVRSDNPAIQKFSDDRMRGAVNIIDPRDPLGASLAIHAALKRGEVVCMLGDRAYGDQPSCRVDFLGKPARFPIGPFHAAAVTGAPIVMCFLMNTGAKSYELCIEPPWHIQAIGRGQQRRMALTAAAQIWANRLERQVRRYPMQWHNFYDFWE